jgi:glycosyltransferase involved in cell wall biosynthesis
MATPLLTMIIACTPTKNRRWSWEFSKACMMLQRQKPDKWIVLDNSTTPAYDWSVSKDYDLVDYHRVYEPMTIGALRNICIEKALALGADYIVFWDDDDYYPPERISTGIKALQKNPKADIAASSRMYVLLTKENVLMEVGPFGDRHGTAATYTLRRRYVESHRFPEKARGEEFEFTNGWTAKMVQVPAEKTILVMGHSRNTVNKSDILKTPGLFKAIIVNSTNGKMAARVRWPIPWDLFRSTFVDGEYVQLQENTPSGLGYSVLRPNPHIEETGASAEHRA